MLLMPVRDDAMELFPDCNSTAMAEPKLPLKKGTVALSSDSLSEDTPETVDEDSETLAPLAPAAG